MSGRLDQVAWKPWAWISESGYVFNREWVIARCDGKTILANANATVILDRMIRRGRLAWYEKMKR